MMMYTIRHTGRYMRKTISAPRMGPVALADNPKTDSNALAFETMAKSKAIKQMLLMTGIVRPSAIAIGMTIKAEASIRFGITSSIRKLRD